MAETRYSKADLDEFKALIEKKLELAREDLSQLRSSMSHKDDNSTEDTAPTFKMMEDGSEPWANVQNFLQSATLSSSSRYLLSSLISSGWFAILLSFDITEKV